jgi:hypothetical protein
MAVLLEDVIFIGFDLFSLHLVDVMRYPFPLYMFHATSFNEKTEENS